MKTQNIIAIVCVMMLILMAACQQQPPAASTPTAPESASSPASSSAPSSSSASPASVPSAPASIAPSAAPITVDPVPSVAMSTDLKKILLRADAKVKSYEFYYSPPPDNLPRDRYYVKGNKIHIVGYRVNVVKNAEYYDNLYIDVGAKTARAFCLGADMRCRKMGKEFAVDYDDVMIKLPYQWVKEISYGDIAGSEQLFDRQTKKVVYDKDGIRYSQWIDEFSGLPLRVKVEAPGKNAETFEFKDLAINSVLDDQLEPPK